MLWKSRRPVPTPAPVRTSSPDLRTRSTMPGRRGCAWDRRKRPPRRATARRHDRAPRAGPPGTRDTCPRRRRPPASRSRGVSASASHDPGAYPFHRPDVERWIEGLGRQAEIRQLALDASRVKSSRRPDGGMKFDERGYARRGQQISRASQHLDLRPLDVDLDDLRRDPAFSTEGIQRRRVDGDRGWRSLSGGMEAARPTESIDVKGCPADMVGHGGGHDPRRGPRDR